ncbi:MAG: DUF4013 domain-containing protein [Methanocalculaceae archaeon]|nr:DUF4013 domain-containing protein [Methanocalculaceae archaeon]
MDPGAILSSSLTYVKETCRPDRWFYLFIYLLINAVTLCIVPLFSGYLYRIMEATSGVPAVSGIKDLFCKGWKMNIAGILYALPFLLITAVFYLLITGFIPAPSNSPDSLGPEAAAMLMGLLLAFIVITLLVSLLLSLLSTLGMVRMTRNGKISEAFNLREILASIKTIGWLDYIAAIIILIVCALAFSIILELITFAFWILLGALGSLVTMFLFLWMLVIILLAAALGVFSARYMVLVYDNKTTP